MKPFMIGLGTFGVVCGVAVLSRTPGSFTTSVALAMNAYLLAYWVHS